MPRHKKHIKNPYLSYEEARKFVRNLTPAITTRAQYLQWHKEHKPGYLPRWPHHVWDNFSWNDFLNTNNSFEKTAARNANRTPRRYRDYWDAVRYAQAQARAFNLSTREDWMRFYEEYDVPEDIPKRPWQEYDDFDIKVWLGLNAVAHLKTAREGNVAVVALHNVVGAANNVVVMRVWKDGYHAMEAAIAADNGMSIGRVIRAFEVEDDNTVPFVERMLHKHGSKGPDGFIVFDINGLLWDLMDLLIATGKKVG
jgi:hypothetical protein